MNTFRGQTLSWETMDGVSEVVLHHAPANEIGTQTLAELEHLVAALPALEAANHGLLLRSEQAAGFSAGADLRELWRELQNRPHDEGMAGVREFLQRIHAAFRALDTSSLTTVAAVHGVVFGGGFELALTCDIIIADRSARFCFPELRLGLVPGFGGIPRLTRDAGNAVARDLLLSGRSLGATRAHTLGIASQLVGEGHAPRAARALLAQAGKFDRGAVALAKEFVKPIPDEALAREIDLFCEMIARPAAVEGLRRFVESTDPLPYLP